MKKYGYDTEKKDGEVYEWFLEFERVFNNFTKNQEKEMLFEVEKRLKYLKDMEENL